MISFQYALFVKLLSVDIYGAVKNLNLIAFNGDHALNAVFLITGIAADNNLSPCCGSSKPLYQLIDHHALVIFERWYHRLAVNTHEIHNGHAHRQRRKYRL